MEKKFIWKKKDQLIGFLYICWIWYIIFIVIYVVFYVAWINLKTSKYSVIKLYGRDIVGGKYEPDRHVF